MTVNWQILLRPPDARRIKNAADVVRDVISTWHSMSAIRAALCVLDRRNGLGDTFDVVLAPPDFLVELQGDNALPEDCELL